MNNDQHDELQLQLRGLRRDLAPPCDLWPGIAAGIAAADGHAAPAAPSAGPAPRPARWRRVHRLLPPLALAASLVLALGVGVRMQSATPSGAFQYHDEALAMAGEYELALAALEQSPLQPELRPALDELDQNAEQILGALQDHPEQRLLFDQLHRTYARRLELTRRATTF